MADLPAQLVVALSADISKLQKQLGKALGDTDAFAKAQEGKHRSSLEKIERMYEQVHLENNFQVAQASGDKGRIRQLQEELELTRQISRFRMAGLSKSDATDAAKAHMSALASAAEGAVGSLNRAQMMELTHVAKSLFDQLAAGASPLRALQVEGGRIAQIFAEGEGGVGGTFQALTGLINPMVVGVGAAVAAFAALLVVVSKVHEATQEAVALKISSDNLGIPVEQLQLWQFIAAQTHVTNQQLQQSFDGLSATLGKLKSGIREQRIEPFIEELGITNADIAKANNAADLMDLIISKMEKIKDPGERVQIADAFGMREGLPLLSRTRAEIQGMTDDFSRNAGVITGEQAKALNAQEESLARLHALMHDKIRADLVELAPLIGSITVAWEQVGEAAVGALADMVKAGEFHPGQAASRSSGPVAAAGGVLHIAGSVFGGQAGGMAADIVAAMVGHVASQGEVHAPAKIPTSTSATGGGYGARALEARKATDDLSKALAEYVTHSSHAEEMTRRIAEDRKNGATVTPQQEASLMSAARAEDAKYGAGQAKKAKDAVDKALEATKASDDQLSAAKKAELKARIALTADLLADHQLKLQELQQDRDTKDRQADQDAKLGKISPAAAGDIKATNGRAYDDGVALENRRFSEAAADQARTYQADLARSRAAHLTASAEIATTTQAWAEETRAAFADQQAADRAAFVDRTDKRTRSMGVDHLDPDQAKAEIAAYDTQQADEASRNNRTVDQAVLERKRQYADQLAGYLTSTLQAEADMATSASQRRALEKRILDIRQQQAREELQRQVSAPGYQGDADAARAGLYAQQGAERAQFDEQHADPIAAWAQSVQKATGDVNQAFQTEAVRGLDGFNSALANSIVNAKNFGDAFKGVLRSITEDLVQLVLRQGEVGLFGLGSPLGTPSIASLSAALPHFAAGTDDAPGGTALVGENGPEEVELPQGSKVIPNSTLRAAQNVSAAQVRSQAITMNHNVTIDLAGANGDATIARVAHAAATEAYAQSVATSRKDLRRSQQSASRSFIG